VQLQSLPLITDEGLSQMKLSSFIRDNLETILQEWDAFARTMEPAASDMSEPAIRDDARHVLLSIAQDIDAEQSTSQQIEKSKGHAPGEPNALSPASEHGEQRRLSGFSLVQLAAEYRALRATVIRLWMENPSSPTGAITNDIVRFNETIDQALAESIATYTAHAERTRDTFLAILGHDLRSPLATISMVGDLLVRPDNTDRTIKLGAKVKRGAAAMSIMVSDLLEFARTQLGSEIPLVPKLADLREVCQWGVDDASAVHPGCTFKLETSGELEFCFDTARMQQVFSNLLNNAAQFHTGDQPVTIAASSEAGGGAIIVEVRNFGTVISSESLGAIFDPLVQLPVEDDQNARPSTSLGLGLFIAREITTAHGGTIAVTSNKIAGTVLTVRIPRSVEPQPKLV